MKVLNRSIVWQRKVDDFFNRFEDSRKAMGKRFDKTLTVITIACVIIMTIAIVYTIIKANQGTTNWAFWLQNIDVEKAINSPYEIFVIDYSRDGSQAEAFSKVDIARIKAKGKQVYAYLSVGEAENYRYYWNTEWNTNKPVFIADENPDWEGNYLVQYWTPEWKALIVTGEGSYLQQIIDAGYDGVYLDKVDAYETWEEKTTADSPEGSSMSYRQLMGDLIVTISDNAKDQKPDFKVYIQNGLPLLEQENVFAIVDGIGVENLYYEDGNDRSEEAIGWDINYLDQVVTGGKQVLVVEYIADETQTNNFCTKTGQHGFIPYVSNLELDTLPDEKVCK